MIDLSSLWVDYKIEPYWLLTDKKPPKMWEIKVENAVQKLIEGIKREGI